MRDIIRLFSDRESRDELGLGAIRDDVSDGLFPGTSTLLTRARYLLFVPWVYQLAAGSDAPLDRANQLELRLIEALRAADDTSGLLGVRAGKELRTLPSQVYWSMLGRYGILTDPSMTREGALLAERTEEAGAWSGTLPEAPQNFPRAVTGGLQLSSEEAGWLRDRILAHAPDTAFAHLMVVPPEVDSRFIWADPVVEQLGGPAQLAVENARAFSAVMHGAQLLYNLLLATEYEAHGFDNLNDPADRYREELSAWADRLPSELDLATWQLDDFLAGLEYQRGRPYAFATRVFVRDWLALCRGTDPGQLATDASARELIRRRERHAKGSQARLGNPRRLSNWGGGSGHSALAFRWGNARTIARDIHAGLSASQVDAELAEGRRA